MSEKEAKITARLDKYLQTGEMAGASLLIRQNGQKVYQHICGYANLETGERLAEQHIFRLASMTKPVTGIAAMQLVEQGKLGLDDSVAEYLPGFEAKKAVKIVDLLNHSSGLGQDQAGNDYVAKTLDPKDNLAERVNKWAGMPFDFEPGSATGYSGLVGFDMLGRIIEIVSGQEVPAYFRQHIFEPLGMRDTTFVLTPEQAARTVRLYEAEKGKINDVTATDPTWKMISAMENNYFSASGGLLGTLPDYDKILQMLAGGGKYGTTRLLKEETVRQMRTESARHKKEVAPGVVWGLSMVVYGAPEQTGLPMTAGTFGWSGAFGTHFFIDGQKKIEALLMLNLSNIGGAASYISREVERLVYEVYG